MCTPQSTSSRPDDRHSWVLRGHSCGVSAWQTQVLYTHNNSLFPPLEASHTRDATAAAAAAVFTVQHDPLHCCTAARRHKRSSSCTLESSHSSLLFISATAQVTALHLLRLRVLIHRPSWHDLKCVGKHSHDFLFVTNV